MKSTRFKFVILVALCVCAESIAQTPHELLLHGDAIDAANALAQMQEEPEWVHKCDADQRTPLHLAARFGHVRVVEWLIENGADVNALAYHNFTPLHLTESPKVAKILLEANTDLTIEAVSGTSYQAALNRLIRYSRLDQNDFPNLDKEILHIRQIVDAHLRHMNEKIDLIWAVQLGLNDALFRQVNDDPEIIKERVSLGNTSGMHAIGTDATILHYAALYGTPEMINFLIDSGVPVFVSTSRRYRDPLDRQTALDIAVRYGRADNLLALLGHPKYMAAIENVEQVYPRLLAKASVSSRNPIKMLKLLFSKGAKPSSLYQGKNLIEFVGESGWPGSPEYKREFKILKSVVEFLRRNGVEHNLNSLVAFGEFEEATRFLKNNENVDSRRSDGFPTLHFAILLGDLRMVKLLVENGFDIEIRNESKTTLADQDGALHVAVFCDNKEMAEYLIELGIDLDSQNRSGDTPLHIAAFYGHIKLAALLLEAGADSNIKNSGCKTPIEVAQGWRVKSKIKKLIEKDGS